ncbi:hypothetical protein [Desulfobacter postgatei]|uniref:hypothetical protein n=1 Tax=Desulfobacter postgatei TaxID=2293 RepID=UPI00259B2416|nr:hypothetical protein [uncultured Desulfobacter sp.]
MPSVTRRRISVLAMFIVICMVSLPFIYIEFNPTIYADITLVADDKNESGFHLEQPIIPLCRVDGKGVATFIFRTRVDHSYGDQFKLKIFPNGASEWFLQPECCTVSKDRISGKAQLGSPKYPLTKPSDYIFRLEDATGVPVITGRIITRIYRYADGPWWATTVLGILASVAQLVSLWRIPDMKSTRKMDHDM